MPEDRDERRVQAIAESLRHALTRGTCTDALARLTGAALGDRDAATDDAPVEVDHATAQNGQRSS
jgi:hypothetical protein